MAWNWRRSPRGRETGELESILPLLRSVDIDRRRQDFWTSDFAVRYFFSIKELSKKLDTESSFQCLTLTIILRYLPPKVNLFLWRARKDFLPTYFSLARRGIDVQTISCPLCSSAIENAEHALLHCSKAFMVWELVARWCGVSGLFLWEIDDLASLETTSLVPKTNRDILGRQSWLLPLGSFGE